MADQEGEGSQQLAASGSLTVPRASALVALAVCFVAGYFLAGWWAA